MAEEDSFPSLSSAAAQPQAKKSKSKKKQAVPLDAWLAASCELLLCTCGHQADNVYSAWSDELG